MKKKSGSAYKEMAQWLGKDFDPEAFDMEEINAAFFKDFKKEAARWEAFAYE